MLAIGIFYLTIPYNTDQEIMAYLYNKIKYYRPEDVKRPRASLNYNLTEEFCADLHFPRKMWLPHLAQIVASHSFPEKTQLQSATRKPNPSHGSNFSE